MQLRPKVSSLEEETRVSLMVGNSYIIVISQGRSEGHMSWSNWVSGQTVSIILRGSTNKIEKKSSHSFYGFAVQPQDIPRFLTVLVGSRGKVYFVSVWFTFCYSSYIIMLSKEIFISKEKKGEIV